MIIPNNKYSGPVTLVMDAEMADAVDAILSEKSESLSTECAKAETFGKTIPPDDLKAVQKLYQLCQRVKAEMRGNRSFTDDI